MEKSRDKSKQFAMHKTKLQLEENNYRFNFFQAVVKSTHDEGFPDFYAIAGDALKKH